MNTEAAAICHVIQLMSKSCGFSILKWLDLFSFPADKTRITWQANDT